MCNFILNTFFYFEIFELPQSAYMLYNCSGFSFNRGLEPNPNMVIFEVTCFLPEVTSIATVEGTVTLLSIDKTTSGFTDTRISMLCNDND